MSDKIRISWDDVQSAQVDQKLQQQGAVARATEHYRQQAVQAPLLPASRSASIWFNPFFSAAIFGLAGGICAWIAGEFLFLVIPDYFDQMRDVIQREAAISASLNRGDITESAARQRMEALHRSYAANPYVQIFLDESLPEDARRRLVQERIAHDRNRIFVQQLIWFSMLGIALATFLAIGDEVVNRNWRASIINGAVGVSLGLAGGVVVGLFINRLYSYMQGDEESRSLVRQIMARTAGWGILGLFLALAPGVALRNVKRSLIGLAGGFAGGVLGGLLFDPVSFVTGNAVLSRLIAIVAIGVIAGLGTGFIENVAKTAWLKVAAGLIAGKQFIIYKNPTVIGSSPQCEIYLFKDQGVAPQHAALRQVGNGYEIQEIAANGGVLVNGAAVKCARLRHADQIQIGGTVFVFQERVKTAS
jgi:hypothetical protein